MSKVLTFSPFFPAYHPRAGQPTDFVGKIWASLLECGVKMDDLHEYMTAYANTFHPDLKPLLMHPAKGHTISAGHRWKVGDKFSPRTWSGKAYRSKQVIIGPDIEIKKVWEIQKHHDFFMINGKGVLVKDVPILAKNDGLSEADLRHWFSEPLFDGQIICWNDKIEY